MGNRFDQKLQEHGLKLVRAPLTTLQVNLGRVCNQACRHCHVDAAPWRTESMSREVLEHLFAWIGTHRPSVVDITGGAPELNPSFRELVRKSREVGCRVMDRNNLTILWEPGQEDLADFLASHEVEIVASLPCYSPENVNRQRGNGVFDKSIRALQKLNELGYGTVLPLHLVYNPLGAKLPGPQAELEADYKEVLLREFGIRFHHLYTLTNQPIARFAESLREENRLEEYMALLLEAFNPGTVAGLMCRDTLSVDYQGRLFDCDFNQMLELPMAGKSSRFLWDVSAAELENQSIQTGDHCLACTAGAGSSCTGTVTS